MKDDSPSLKPDPLDKAIEELEEADWERESSVNIIMPAHSQKPSTQKTFLETLKLLPPWGAVIVLVIGIIAYVILQVSK